ncbi:MAG: preprotein translocase subunit YajC [Planctomycetaceae bacterium]|nr:preprotein translocase subunit YajC [Planctomycetaceae bacterium]
MGTAALALIGRLALSVQGAAAPGGGGGGGGGQPADPWSQIFQGPLPLLILLFAVFYFIIMRPQRREQARRKEMLANVKKNDRVVTIGGVYGVVSNVERDKDEVTIRVDETTNTKLRMTLSSVSRVLGDGASDDSEKK